MTTPDQRLKKVRSAHLSAAKKFNADIKAAENDTQKNLIAANLLALKGAHQAAIECGMTENNAAIQDAFSGLTAANQEVTQARADAEAIAKIIEKVTKAAGLATKLVGLSIL